MIFWVDRICGDTYGIAIASIQQQRGCDTSRKPLCFLSYYNKVYVFLSNK